MKKALLIVALLGLGGFLAYRSFFTPVAEKKSGPQLVTIASVEQREMPIILELTGNVVAANLVDIRPQTTNVVSAIHIREGQLVRQGDLLFSLDDRADRANFEKAKAVADDAARQYRRAQELLEKKFISQAAFDTALANMASAQAAARAAEATLSYDSIRSPISGRAGVINVFVGSLVQAGANVVSSTTATATSTIGAMVTITQIDPINVQFLVPEKDIPLIAADSQLTDRLTVSVDVPGLSAPVSGKVVVIDNQIDAALGAIRLKAQLRNSDGRLIPGQFVRIRLTAKTVKDALVVPSQAIVTNIQGDHLYVVGGDNKVALVPVKVAYQYQGRAMVSGVNAGDRVVVEGKQNLRPGNTIREGTPPQKSGDTPVKKDAAAKDAAANKDAPAKGESPKGELAKPSSSNAPAK